MVFRGGHGRTPGATDSRQGTARADTYLKQTKAGVLVVIFTPVFMVAVYVAGVFLFDPDLRPWGLTGVAVIAVGIAAWQLRKRGTRTSIKDSLGNLGEDKGS